MQSEKFVPIAVSLTGLVALGVFHLSPAPQDSVTALLFPPTLSRATVLQETASLGLPIRDVHWNGYLVELDISDLPEHMKTGLAGLVAQPAIQLSLRSAVLCANTPISKENQQWR
ncbi:hypothetical protein [Roseinatronobacter sp.]